MEKKKIICICGESCSGKDTLTQLAIKMAPSVNFDLKMKFICSYTTRPKRDYETNGKEHWFVTDEEADKLINENTILAYTQIGEYRYFTILEKLNNENVYIIDPYGIKNSLIPLVYKDKIEICIIYINTPKFIREYRSKKRNDDNEIYKKRKEAEEKQFNDFRKELKLHGYKNQNIINNIFGLKYYNAKKICKIANEFLNR